MIGLSGIGRLPVAWEDRGTCRVEGIVESAPKAFEFIWDIVCP